MMILRCAGQCRTPTGVPDSAYVTQLVHPNLHPENGTYKVVDGFALVREARLVV